MIDKGFGIFLCTIDRDEKDLLRLWRNDYKIWKWCRQNDLISEQAHDRWFEAQDKDPSIKMYMIKDKRMEPLGVCGLTSIDYVNSRAEFSLYVAPGAQGKGIGKAALKTLISHGFANLGLNCIWGETYEGNPAARMFESIGMMKEGTRREFYYRDGHFIDCHLYSILRSDWYNILPLGTNERFDDSKSNVESKPPAGSILGEKISGLVSSWGIVW